MPTFCINIIYYFLLIDLHCLIWRVFCIYFIILNLLFSVGCRIFQFKSQWWHYLNNFLFLGRLTCLLRHLLGIFIFWTAPQSKVLNWYLLTLDFGWVPDWSPLNTKKLAKSQSGPLPNNKIWLSFRLILYHFNLKWYKLYVTNLKS